MKRANCGRWMKPLYSVVGINNSNEYPYVNELCSLREAINIAKKYPILEPNGACTRIKRHFRFKCLDSGGFISGISHEWYVFNDGVFFLSRDYKGNKSGIDSWLEKLPSPPKEFESYRSLRSELWDIERIAHALGYQSSVNYLFRLRHEEYQINEN
jgi:hypothetical protein